MGRGRAGRPPPRRSPSSSGASARARSGTACARWTPGRWRPRRLSALLTTVCCAWRWRIVARGHGVALSLPAAVAAYYRSVFLNLALPGGVVGDVHRGVSHGRDEGDVGRASGRSRGSAALGQARADRADGRRPARAAVAGRPLMPLAAVALVAAVGVCSCRARPAVGVRVGRLRRRPATSRGAARRALPAIVLTSALVVARPRADVPDRRAHRRRHGAAVADAAAGAAGAGGDGAARRRRLGAARGRPGVGVRRRRPGRGAGVATAVVYGVMVFVASLPGRARARRRVAFRRSRSGSAGGGPPMRDRPYTLLSCSVSIDGYIGSATSRLLLSNDDDFERVDAVRASCDAILVGAATVRMDNPRLLVRSRRAARAADRPRRAPSPMKVTVTRRAELDPDANFFTAGDVEKLVYCPSPRVPDARARLEPAATVVDGGNTRRHAQPQQRPGRPRRGAADGRGRRKGAHAVPDRRPRGRAAAGRRAAVRRRLPALRGSCATAASPGTPASGRSWPTSGRSATWCCCATRCPRGSQDGLSYGRGCGPNAREEAVAERAHRPHRRVASRAHAVRPAPAARSCAAPPDRGR